MAGLDLDPWQQYVLAESLGEREDGKWAAFEVGIEVPRQNGKGGLLEARELAGLFLLGEGLLIHSAHEFATAEEALERMDQLLEANSDLSRRVRTLKRSHGQEGVYLKTGQRLRYRTRTKGGGRGFSADWVALDEAMIIPEAMHGALMPTLSARPNPQLWYTGSAVDQRVHEHGVVFARVRERGLSGTDPSLAYFGWSVDADSPDKVSGETATDPEAWATANPGLGIRISTEHIAREQRSMDARTFAVERLGVGDWPATDDSEHHVIPLEVWAADADRTSKAVGPVCFAIDASPDRSSAAIGMAGRRADGLRLVEVVDHRAGTTWVPERVAALLKKHDALPEVQLDGYGPAASLIEPLESLGITVKAVSAKEYAQACGTFYDACGVADEQPATLRHGDQPELNAAVKGAAWRSLGEARAWSRKNSSVDISPLVAVTLALAGSSGGAGGTGLFNPNSFRIRRPA